MTCPSLSSACPPTTSRTTRSTYLDSSHFPEDFLRPDDRSPLEGIDESFVFTYDTYADELGKGQRWSRWQDLEALMKGPEPRPDWVVTSSGAIDTELGILKTGKEADVFLLEREDPHRPDGAVVMAAKRYRDTDHRTFHRAASYTEGRSMKRSRDERALKRKSTWGKQVAAGEWAISEWNALLPLLGARPAGPLPGADRRDRDPDGVDHRDRRRGDRDRPAGRPGPARSARWSRATTTSCATP